MQNNQVLFSQITLEDLGKFIEEKVNKAFAEISFTKKDSQNNSLYTRREVSELLKVSLTTLFNWNNSKILVAKKIGNRVYYSKSDVEARINY